MTSCPGEAPRAVSGHQGRYAKFRNPILAWLVARRGRDASMSQPEIEFSKVLIERTKKERDLLEQQIQESQQTIERSRKLLAELDNLLARLGVK